MTEGGGPVSGESQVLPSVLGPSVLRRLSHRVPDPGPDPSFPPPVRRPGSKDGRRGGPPEVPRPGQGSRPGDRIGHRGGTVVGEEGSGRDLPPWFFRPGPVDPTPGLTLTFETRKGMRRSSRPLRRRLLRRTSRVSGRRPGLGSDPRESRGDDLRGVRGVVQT